jgi:hypothetical protein
LTRGTTIVKEHSKLPTGATLRRMLGFAVTPYGLFTALPVVYCSSRSKDNAR